MTSLPLRQNQFIHFPYGNNNTNKLGKLEMRDET
jgi:hypothetical protein